MADEECASGDGFVGLLVSLILSVGRGASGNGVVVDDSKGGSELTPLAFFD